MATTIGKNGEGDVDGQEAPVDSATTKKDKLATRRQLLRLAGAAALGAAGAVALEAVPASANDGDPVLTGGFTVETEGFATEIFQAVTGHTVWIGVGETSSTGFYGVVTDSGTGVYGKVVQTHNSGGIGVRGEGGSHAYGAGVFGNANGNFAIGVSGNSTGGFVSTGVAGYGSSRGVIGISDASYGDGVFGYSGSTNGTGLLGEGRTGVYAFNTRTNGYALYAYSGHTGSLGARVFSRYSDGLVSGSSATGGLGVLGYGALGVFAVGEGSGEPGVLALSFSGPDAALVGTGRLAQNANITGGAGAPSFTPSSTDFELVRDGTGGIWANSVTGTGLPTGQAAWKRVNAVRVDSADGTGGVFKPFRVIDTRSGTIRAAGSVNPVTVAGTGSGASAIPLNAIAVMGNLTAVNYTGPGFLTIMPAGITIGSGTGQYNPNSDPSSVNFIVGQVAIANSFVCGLNSAGQLQVYVGDVSSNFIIDITAYVQ